MQTISINMQTPCFRCVVRSLPHRVPSKPFGAIVPHSSRALSKQLYPNNVKRTNRHARRLYAAISCLRIACHGSLCCLYETQSTGIWPTHNRKFSRIAKSCFCTQFKRFANMQSTVVAHFVLLPSIDFSIPKFYELKRAKASHNVLYVVHFRVDRLWGESR